MAEVLCVITIITHRECVIIDNNTHAVCIINIKKFLNIGPRLHFPLLSSSHSCHCNSNFFLPLCQFRLFIVLSSCLYSPFRCNQTFRCTHSRHYHYSVTRFHLHRSQLPSTSTPWRITTLGKHSSVADRVFFCSC